MRLSDGRRRNATPRLSPPSAFDVTCAPLLLCSSAYAFVRVPFQHIYPWISQHTLSPSTSSNEISNSICQCTANTGAHALSSCIKSSIVPNVDSKGKSWRKLEPQKGDSMSCESLRDFLLCGSPQRLRQGMTLWRRWRRWCTKITTRYKIPPPPSYYSLQFKLRI